MDQRSCRHCVEQEPRNLDGSRSCQGFIKKKPRNLDGSKSCLEGGEHRKIPRWIENLSRIYWEIRKKSSIERNLLRICQGAVKLEEKEVFKKHIEMNATNKLLKQTSKPHIKLSNLISNKTQSIHRSKNTHIH